jgi:DNA-directed RNA polymerase subunit RPC12/RpoP
METKKRLVYAEDVLSRIDNDKLIIGQIGTIHAKSAVNRAKTVDAVEVVHGRWMVNTDDFTPAYRCSACGYNKPMIAGERISQGAMNYCPTCGAKMDGDGNG